jgi:photosystem II stability/assembly factor-like uncharacterized protein
MEVVNFAALRWRLIGPFRAGRVSAGAIDPSDANTYYFGAPGGGVWKTTNAAQTWTPIFDQTGVASVGALAVAVSNSHVIYVGTGEETRGNGVYKSSDGGSTWKNVGLGETHFIGSIIISPDKPEEVLVAAIGDRAPGPDRGVFRTTDGGETWSKVLFVDDDNGCPSIAAAEDAPRVVYATCYRAAGNRGASPVPPIGTPPPNPESGTRGYTPSPAVFRSTDGGATWTRAAAKGLASAPVGRQAFGVVAASGGRIVLAGLRDGLFRSEDSGETWTRATDDPRIRPVGVITDPRNSEVLYVTQTSLYRSTDGGRTFDALAGAPSGDDFQLLWIDPRNSKRVLAGVDQGAIISVDGGASWSSWYNQPTGQFYHVATDDRFPYHVFAAQQDSGSVAVPNRSDYGEISYRDWYSPGGFEFGYLAPDPLDPDIVFAGGWYRTVVRFDRKTGQFAHMFAPGTKYRSVNNAPMAFAPKDPHTLYYGTQFLMKTTDSGMTWQEVSPDLTDVPVHATPQRSPQVPSITTFSLSTVEPGVMWAATNNGVVQVTRDGGATWRNVSPADAPSGGAFEIIDAGRHDAGTAYAAYIVPNDVRPYIYRTLDGGATWQKIVRGLPETAFVRVVREDPVRKGLLYCGTESGVWVSFDAGDDWQSLQLNLPASSMRDMVVHGDDLVLATYGRALWILDNLTPLRQLTPGAMTAAMQLLQPSPAIRARWDVNGDTPLPIETPAAPNPPEGAIVDYYLKEIPAGDMTLTVSDERGQLVRTFSSVAEPAPTLLANVPSYWFGPPEVLSKNAGLNRFAWNLRYPPPKILPFGYFGAFLPYVEYTLADHAIPGRTPREQPEGALVVPGQYTIELSAAGRRETQTLVVKPDPRVKASQADLLAQFELANQLAGGLAVSYDGYNRLALLRTTLADRLKSFGGSKNAKTKDGAALQAFEKRLDAVQNGTAAAPGLGVVNREMARLFSMVESADARPSEPLRSSSRSWCDALTIAVESWHRLNSSDLPTLNSVLARHKQPALEAVNVPEAPSCRR